MVLRTAASLGCKAYGVDMDPLAVLMAGVWTAHVGAGDLSAAARNVVDYARGLDPTAVFLPWIDEDPETSDFISYWFAEPQLGDLRRLSFAVESSPVELRDPLKLALSRIIITKKRGASLAWDVSHSRPHRVRQENDYDVFGGFCKAADYIAKCLTDDLTGSASVTLGDARKIDFIPDDSVDLVMTSPPYLNAIDYLRGHRMSLVWLGFSIGELRGIRSDSVGAERMLRNGDDDLSSLISDTWIDDLSVKMRGILLRYARDAMQVMAEVHRVLKSGAEAILVVGNSTVRGTFVDNAGVMRRAGEACGLRTTAVTDRELPSVHRYLPPPTASGGSLDKRMRTEVIISLAKA
jgi:hypothetical protein